MLLSAFILMCVLYSVSTAVEQAPEIRFETKDVVEFVDQHWQTTRTIRGESGREECYKSLEIWSQAMRREGFSIIDSFDIHGNWFVVMRKKAGFLLCFYRPQEAKMEFESWSISGLNQNVVTQPQKFGRDLPQFYYSNFCETNVGSVGPTLMDGEAKIVEDGFIGKLVISLNFRMKGRIEDSFVHETRSITWDLGAGD